MKKKSRQRKSEENMDKVKIKERPNCAICGKPAEYDAKTIYRS